MPQNKPDETPSSGDGNDRRPEPVSADYLRECLTKVDEETASKRLMVGINHKQGATQTELADWFDVSRTTIHNWLNRLERLEDESLEEVVYDDERPGRPSKLDPSQQKQLEEVLRKSPKEAGYKAREWTPKLVRGYIKEMFHVEYTLGYVREILREEGISWDTSQTRSQDETHIQEAFKNTQNGDDSSEQWIHGCRR
jgi:transposase